MFTRPRRLAPDKLLAAKKVFQEMIDLGTCRPSKSSWANALHMVTKRNGEYRPCGDYRQLNKITVPDRYPLPNIQDCTSFLDGKTVFSKIDLTKAYQQIPVLAQDVAKTAITTPFGLFEFPFMPFGLKNAAQTFQRFVNEVLSGLDCCFSYIDDILVASTNETQHYIDLQQVLDRLAKYGLKINLEKCDFLQSSISFLGHNITASGASPLPHKVQALIDFPRPTTVKQMRQYLGMLNFYRRFIPRTAHTQAPLNSVCSGKDKQEIKWTSEMTRAFEQSKKEIANATLLAHPRYNAPLSISTDASDHALGGVVHQLVNHHLQPLGFYSRKLTPTERRYSAYDRELLALFSTIKHFSYLLEGRKFAAYTDHKPLVYAFLQNADKASPRQSRQLSYISQFTTDIRHIKGEENSIADMMSRVETIDERFPAYSDMARLQETDEELKKLLSSTTTSLQLEQTTLDNGDKSLYCDVSTGSPRPYVPVALREVLCRHFHGFSHPGGRATTNLIAKRFIWPSMNKYIKNFVRNCLSCQKSKINKHEKSPLQPFLPPDERFAVVHIDIVGPLPSSRGYRYLLTCIDRFTRWTEAIPLSEITAEAVAQAFWENWICRFGTPRKMVTDQGRNFESNLFRSLCRLMGIDVGHTTAYHPQSNGIIERWHRTLKTSLMCRLQSVRENWVQELPGVLLGLRSAMKDDLQASPAEFVYGTQLRLPGEFFQTSNNNVDTHLYLQDLKSKMRQVIPKETSWHSSNKYFQHPDLDKSSHVFLRDDTVRPPLTQPYKGPYPVVTRSPKTFKILVDGSERIVSRDRLKPAHFSPPCSSDPSQQPQLRRPKKTVTFAPVVKIFPV